MHENQVIGLMCKWLSRNGYEIKSTTPGNRPGHDIAAIGPNGVLLYVECKGSTNEEGKEFRPRHSSHGCEFGERFVPVKDGKHRLRRREQSSHP
jgi:hypothetical protein